MDNNKIIDIYNNSTVLVFVLGAGKTESTKQVLHYLAGISHKVASGIIEEGGVSDDFEDRIR